MADNVAYKSDATATIATVAAKELTFSGDTTQVQLCQLVSITGTEGAYTLTEVMDTDGLLVNLGANNDVIVTNAGTFAVQSEQSGTWTVELGTTDNAVLDAIAASVAGTLTVGSHAITDGGGSLTIDVSPGGIGVTDNNGSLTIDNATLSVTGSGLESGALRVTLATDSTGVISIDDNGGSITIDGSVTATGPLTDTELRLTPVPVSGTVTVAGAATAANQATQVVSLALLDDVVTAQSTPLGSTKTSLIGGSVTAAAPTYTDGQINPFSLDTSGALRVTGSSGVTEYTLGTSTYTEATSVGNIAGAVRFDAGGTLVNADNEIAPLQVDASGALRVTASGTITADLGATDNAVLDTIATPIATISSTPLQRVAIFDSSDTQITSFGGTGGTSSTDDAAFAAASGLGTPAMGFFSADTVDAGDVGVLAMDASRRLLCSIEVDNAGIGGGTQYTEGGASDATMTMTMAGMEIAGDLYAPIQGSVADGLLVNLGTNNNVSIDSGTVTVTGVATAANQLADGHGVAASQAGTWNITNVSGTVSLPTGAATAAKQPALGTAGASSADVISVQGIAAGTALIVDGSGVTQPVSGTVTANVGTIGTIATEVTSAAILVDTTNISNAYKVLGSASYVEGVTSGAVAGAVRNDTLAALATTDNEIAPFQVNASGALYVDGSNSTQPISGTVTANAGTGTFTVDGSAVTQPVSGTFFQATQPVSAVSLPLPTGAATEAKQPALGTAGASASDVISVQGIASGTALPVSVASIPSHAVTNAGTFATQLTGGGLTALQLLDNTIVAHDAVISGSTGVSIIGFQARSTEPTAVASADATRGTATLLGKQITLPYAIPASTWNYATATLGVTDTADDEAKAAGAAGIRNYVTGVQVINGHATVATEVVIKDGSTVMWRGWADAVGGGVSAKFDPPLRGTAATAVNVANINSGSKTYFNLQGYQAGE